MSTRRWVLTPRTTGGFALALSLSLAACLGGPDEPFPARCVASVLGAVLGATTLLELNRRTRRQMGTDEHEQRASRAEVTRVEAERAALVRVAEDARTQAAAANHMKDEFLSMLSHELRSPLHATLGWLAILKKGVASGRNVDRAVETIERNVKLQAQLVNDSARRLAHRLRQAGAGGGAGRSGRGGPHQRRPRPPRRRGQGGVALVLPRAHARFWCSATRSGSSRWWATCWRTPSSSPRRAAG